MTEPAALTIFLDNSATPYNFDAFANEIFVPDYSLGYYLKQGDSVNKLPNSSVLTLQKMVKPASGTSWHLRQLPKHVSC